MKLLLALTCLSSLVLAEEEVAAAAAKPDEKKFNKGEITCSYDCDLFSKDRKAYFANIEILYWTVNEGALDYAIKMKAPAWGTPTDAVGHYKRAEFGWAPGVRFNIGWFNAPHYWDAYAQYTYFYDSGHEGVNAPKDAGLFLNGTWPQPDPSGSVPLAHAHSEISFWTHLVDLVVTRRFHPNPHLRIRVNGGAKVGWLRQNWEINYRDTAGNKSHLHNLWHFVGAGLQIGGIVDWFMGKGGIYVTGGITGSCMAGDYHNSSKQSSSFAGAGFNPALPLRNAHYQDTRLIPHFQAFAGPSWQQSYDKTRMELYIGYELNIWANLQEVIRTSQDKPTAAKLTTLDSGWIGIQGVTLRYNLDF